MLLTPKQILPNPVASPQGSGSAHLQPWHGLGGLIRDSHTSSPHSCPSQGLLLSHHGPVPLLEFSSSLGDSGWWTPIVFVFRSSSFQAAGGDRAGNMWSTKLRRHAIHIFLPSVHTLGVICKGIRHPVWFSSFLMIMAQTWLQELLAFSSCLLPLLPGLWPSPGRCRRMVSITRPQQTCPWPSLEWGRRKPPEGNCVGGCEGLAGSLLNCVGSWCLPGKGILCLWQERPGILPLS